MIRVGLLALGALAVVATATPVPANPFGGPAPAGSPTEGRGASDGDRRAAARPAPMGAEGGFRLPGPLNAFVAQINVVQRRLNQVVSRQMRAISETGSPMALLTVTAVAFAYGVLHAAGPGHGKMVVSSFFLARQARLGRGILVGGLISLLQVLSSIAIVALLALVLDFGGFDIVNRSTWVELVSYGLIVLIGLYMVGEVLTGHGHHHGTHGEGDRTGTGLIIAAGLTPCASAIILMLFALANGVFLVGVGAALVMAVGMGITVSVVGLAAIAARTAVVGSMGSHPRAAAWVGRALAVTGATLLTVVGSLFFVSAWTRLG